MGIFKRLQKQIAVLLLLLFFTNMGQAADGYTWTKLPDNIANKTGTWRGVAGSSNGSKLVAVNQGGFIYTSNNGGATWTENDSLGSRDWWDACSSSDGTKLAIVANNSNIYTSTDSGATWIERTNSGSRTWYKIACSADGTKLFAVCGTDYIYRSTDSGATWTTYGSASNYWYGISCSSDGQKVVAAHMGGYIYTSTDGGATWTQQTNAGSRSWTDVVSSSDGTYLAASPLNGYIYTSNDSGVTWVEQTSSGSRQWLRISGSSDGSKLNAVYSSGYIYNSTDYGSTWATQAAAGAAIWYDVCNSSDGTKIIAGKSGGGISYSENSGSSWTHNNNVGNRAWYGISVSSDGMKIAAAATNSGGYIYTSTDGGTTWTERSNAGARYWNGIVISADGTKILALCNGNFYLSIDGGDNWIAQTSAGSGSWGTGCISNNGSIMAVAMQNGYIYISTDSGSTWVQKTNSGSRYWTSIDCSDNGAKIAATTGNGSNYIFTSTDTGETWIQRENGGSYSWSDIASSSDGSKMAAILNGRSIYLSTDSGATWTANITAGNKGWQTIASSNDGNKIMAGVYGSYIYTSTDQGVTWKENNTITSRGWRGVDCSSDGNKIFACAINGGIIKGISSSSGSSLHSYLFNKSGDEVTYTASKSGNAFGTITMSESKLGVGTLGESNFSDVVMNISAAGKPNLIIPAATNAIAATINADLANNAVVTASFTGLPKQKAGKVPPIIMNGVQISDSKGNVFPAYTGYVRNISWDNATGTLTFGITHFTEYGVPVLIGKTFAGTAANAALNTNGTNINVAYTGGSITGTTDHDRSVTVKKISGLSYETVLSDVPATVNNLYRPLVPGVTYNISFEYINRGNATDQIDLATSITRANAGHFTVDGDQSKNVAPWQVASFNVEIDADNALAYERATVDVTIDINGEIPVSYNGFSDAYQGGTFASDGRYGGADNLSHRFVLEAQGYDLTILSRGVTVNAPAGYTGTPVSETNLVPGVTIKYSIAVRNNNYAVATSINITDVIPNACHLYYTDLPSVEGAQSWAWRGATDNMATTATNEAVKFEITIPARATVTASYTVTLD